MELFSPDPIWLLLGLGAFQAFQPN